MGAETVDALRRLRPDVAFLGTNGISESHGLSTPDPDEAAVKRAIVAGARRVVLLADADKLGQEHLVRFAELREVARRSEVPVFSLGIGSETTFRRMFDPVGGIGIPGRPPGRGPRLPGGWPGGGGGGWPGGGGRGRSTATEADFDARPLLDLAEDTGGRAAILKGLERDRGGKDRLQEAVETIAVTIRLERTCRSSGDQLSVPGSRARSAASSRSQSSISCRIASRTEGGPAARSRAMNKKCDRCS